MTSELVIREVFSDVTFVKRLFAMETLQEVQVALKEKNVDLDELVYGPEGFMQTKYPNGFGIPADIIYIEDI